MTLNKEQRQQEDLILLKKYQEEGDETAFNELFLKYERMIKSIVYKYRRMKFTDEAQRYSLCIYAFTRACQGYDITKNKGMFITYAYKSMERKIMNEADYWSRYGRGELSEKGISIDKSVSQKEGETSIIEVIGGEEDEYFKEAFPKTKNAILQALEETKDSVLKPYLVGMLTEEYSQSELAKMTGTSRQVVNYQVKTFKKKVKEFLEQKQLVEA